MNISKILLPLATVVLTTACSSDDEVTKSPIVVGNSDVEVRLSTGGGTRASIESNAQGLFEANGMGIFMLATADMEVNPDEGVLDWRPEVNPYTTWLNNVEANAVINSDSTATDIVWADKKAKWYPVGNWYSYRFYGYYPRTNWYEIQQQRLYVTFTGLNGTQDIIWGRSEGADLSDEHEKYRYSARYFRQKGYGEKVPSLALEHKMLRMQFYIQGIEDENAEEDSKYASANAMTIDTIMVVNMPTIARMVIANLEDDKEEGTLYPDWGTRLADIGVRGENDGPFEKAQVNNDDLIKVGQPILLPVLDETAASEGITKYSVRVRLRNNTGVVFDDEKPLELNIVSISKFEAGKTYKVVLKIAGPKQISLQAKLAGWEDAEDDSIKDLEFN